MDNRRANVPSLRLGSQMPPASLAAGGGVSHPAALVGQVAALQEESGQLRNQWNSDISRLERELGELRSAAAWAMPRLNVDPSRTLLPVVAQQDEPGHSTFDDQLYKMQATYPGAHANGSMTERVDRDRHRGMNFYNDPELSGHQRGTNAYGMRQSDTSSALSGADARMTIDPRNTIVGRGHSPMGRVSSTPGSNNRLSVESDDTECSGFSFQQDASRMIGRSIDPRRVPHAQGTPANHHPDDFRMIPRSQSPAMSHISHNGPAMSQISHNGAMNDRIHRDHEVHPDDSASGVGVSRGLPHSLLDQVRAEAPTAMNLANLAHQDRSSFENWRKDDLINALQQALEDNRKLKEERDTCKAAHSRDISTLEHMLSEVTAEKKRLSASVEHHKGELRALSTVIEGRPKQHHRGLSSNSSALSTSLDTTSDSISTCSHDHGAASSMCSQRSPAFFGTRPGALQSYLE